MPAEEVGELEECGPSCPKLRSVPLGWQQEEEGAETLRQTNFSSHH